MNYQPRTLLAACHLVLLCTMLLMVAPLPATARSSQQQAEPTEPADTLGVQEFLEHQPGPLKQYHENGLSAATIIENNSHFYGLSPRLHLVTIETVTKLLSESNPPEQTIRHPFGAAGPDGFTAQMEWFSREIRAGLGPYDEPPVLHFTDRITRELDLDQRPEIIAIQRFLAIDRTFTEWLRLKKRFNDVFEYYFESQLPDLYSHVDEEETPPPPDAEPSAVPEAPPHPTPPDDDAEQPDSGASMRWSDTKHGFLHLPWPAGTRVYHLAYFDHIYPTVDSGPDGNAAVITYRGGANVQYSSHDGHDYSFPDRLIGTPILAAAPGRAYALSYPGNGVVIEHAHGYETVYWHLDSFDARFNGLVDSGRSVRVETGDMLGTSGMSGFTVGTPHLHFEVRHYGKQVDPYGWYGSGPDPCLAYAGCGESVWLWHPDLIGTYDFTPPESADERGIDEEDQEMNPPGGAPGGSGSEHPPTHDGAAQGAAQYNTHASVSPAPPGNAPQPEADTSPPAGTISINPRDDVLLHVPFDGHIVQQIGAGIPIVHAAPTFDGGRYGQSIYLPPAGGLTYPTTGNLNPAAGTLCMWVHLFDAYLPNASNQHSLFAASAHPHDVAGDHPGTLALRRDLQGADGSPQWNFWSRPLQGEGVRHDLTAPDTLQPGWHHIGVAWDAAHGFKALYLDGVLAAYDEGVALPADVGALLEVGRFNAHSPQSGFFFDELTIFARALTEDEMSTLAQAAAPPDYSSTTLHSRDLLIDTNAIDPQSNIATVEIGRDGVFEPPQPYYDRFQWRLPPIAGMHMLEVRYTDHAGNTTSISQPVTLVLSP